LGCHLPVWETYYRVTGYGVGRAEENEGGEIDFKSVHKSQGSRGSRTLGFLQRPVKGRKQKGKKEREDSFVRNGNNMGGEIMVNLSGVSKGVIRKEVRGKVAEKTFESYYQKKRLLEKHFGKSREGTSQTLWKPK